MKTLQDYNQIVILLLVLFVTCVLITSIRNQAFADSSASQLSQTIASGSHVYVTWDERSNGIFSAMFTQSADYGATFGKTIKIASDIGFEIPRKVVASGNNVYLAWAIDNQNSHGIFLRKSSDYGNTFEPVVMLSDPSKLCNSVTDLKATESYVYVFFSCYNSASQEGSIMFTASHDNGTTFGKPIVLSQGREIYTNIFLSTAAQGKNVFVVSQKDYNISHRDSVLFRKSVDGGDTFSDAIDLSNNKNSHVNPQVISNKNHIYVIWRDYDDPNFDDLSYRKSDDNGNTFGNIVKINTHKKDTELYNIPFLQASGNNVYISWEETRQESTQPQYQLLRTSIDGGNSFGPEQKLTDTLSMRYDLRQGGIALGLGQNVYYLYPGMSDPTFDIAGIFFKKSSNGAKTFGTEIDLNKLNSSPHDMYDPQISVSGNNIYVTGDTQDSGNEIFFVSSHDNGTTFGKIININSYDSNMSKTRVLSPLAQINSGMASQNVKCQDDLELVINSKKSPACVRHVHLPRLLSHGWIYGVDDTAEIASKTMQDILKVGEKIPQSNGLVPVTITEIIPNAESLDSVMDWNFIPIGYNGDNRGTTWDFIPQSYPLKSGVVDSNENDIVDKSRMPENFGITLELRLYPAICNTTEKVMGEGGHPYSIPIKKGNPTVFVYSGGRGILPDLDGRYTVNFVSLFETKMEFPKDAQVISNETKSCFLEHRIDNYTKAFYTKAVFRLD